MLCARLNVRYTFSFLTLMPASHQTFQALLVSQTNFHRGIKILTVLWKLILMVRCRVSIKKSFSFLEWLINSDFSNINVHFSDLAFSLTKNRHIIFRHDNFPDHSKSFQSLVECGRYKINFLFCLHITCSSLIEDVGLMFRWQSENCLFTTGNKSKPIYLQDYRIQLPKSDNAGATSCQSRHPDVICPCYRCYEIFES